MNVHQQSLNIYFWFYLELTSGKEWFRGSDSYLRLKRGNFLTGPKDVQYVRFSFQPKQENGLILLVGNSMVSIFTLISFCFNAPLFKMLFFFIQLPIIKYLALACCIICLVQWWSKFIGSELYSRKITS